MIFENSDIKHVVKDNIEYLQFKKLLAHEEVNHAYILSSHDMNFRVGNNFEFIDRVKANLKIMCDNCGFDYNTILRPDYDHTSNVNVVDRVDISKEVPEIRGKRFPQTDGLIANQKDITIMSTNADCLLVLLYDPIKKVIGNIHAGWKGSFNKIVKIAIDKMKSEFGCNPEDIEAYFSPSIRKCHFEVDEDVKDICKNNFEYTGRLDEIISMGETKEGKQKYLIDNVLINKILLIESGVKESNIVDSKICSICHKDQIHSRRAEGLNFGLRSRFYNPKIIGIFFKK